MTVYTVHERKPRGDEIDADPDRTVFVRDGFYFWAFLLGPLWMLWHRLWLVLVLFLAGTVAMQWGLQAAGMPDWVKFMVGFLVAVLVGCEAGTLRRWSLRRRFTEAGLVVAPDLETAERRYFELGVDHPRLAPSSAPPPPMPPAPAATDVLGLFPQPQPRP